MSNNNLTVKPSIASLISHSAPEKSVTSKEASGNDSFQSTLKTYANREKNAHSSLKQPDKTKEHMHSADTAEKTSPPESASDTVSVDNTKQSSTTTGQSITTDALQSGSVLSENADAKAAVNTPDTAASNNETVPTPPSLVNILAAQSFNEKLQQTVAVPENEANKAQSDLAAISPEHTLTPESIIAKGINTPQSQSSAKAVTAPQVSEEFKAALTDTISEQAISEKTSIEPLDKLVNSEQLNLSSIAQSESGLKTTSSLQPKVTHTIASHFYSDNWGNDLQQQVVSFRHNNIDSATLRLNPEHLGPIEVNIKLDPQSQTYIQFWSENPEVRQAIRDSLPGLNTLFTQSGLQLGNADVSSQQNSGSGYSGSQSTPNRSTPEDTLESLNTDSSDSNLAEVNNLVNVYI